MRQPKNNIFRLKHVLDAINKIESLSTKISKDEFLNDWIIQDAIVRNIEIIGEALKSIDDDFKSNHTEIPWSKARGMRNLLAHEYFRINMGDIWATVQESLPELKIQVFEILKSSESD